jgi:uncharacterized protein
MPERTLILEGIVTTLNADGSPNISPMGPVVDRQLTRLRLRPYQTSRTYQNLLRTGEGVFHVTDDVELIARCAVGPLVPLPPLRSASAIEGQILTDACRWYAFRVQDIDNRGERTMLDCPIVDQGRIRDFFGFNRAKHAVVEAAILATRVQLLDPERLWSQLNELAVWVDKTGGDQEHRAFQFLRQYVQRCLATDRPDAMHTGE